MHLLLVALQLLLAVGMALVVLRERPSPPPAPPPAPPAVAAVPRPTPAPKPAPVSAPREAKVAPQRALLMAAIEARAPELSSCGAPGGTAPTRIRVSALGTVREVSVSGSGLSAEAAECVRGRVRQWQFPGLTLSGDLDVLVTFRFGG